ncbi:hypothetical protein OXIME_000500 [Oxyplasma meridianum]|uniref:Uncharacterized protein n=1 Tax=Oxyplasma meridianum TaxID=3073602 RepID=A0AAX4NEU9_9ARCH
MEIIERDEKIDTYLKSSIKWKDVLRKLQVSILNGENIKTRSVAVSPWSIDQLSISLKCSSDELLKFISKRKTVKITNKSLENQTFKVLEAGNGFDLDVAAQSITKFFEDMDIHLLIRLLVWMNTKRICNQTGEIPSLSDSILTVKNELMVPDDFIPGYMMKLVENGTTPVTAEMLDDIQGKDHLFFLICGFDQERSPYPVSIIPSAGFFLENQLELYEKLMSKTKELFSEISKTQEFKNLTISRTLRALIYQLEKNKKDLSGYLWKGEKMAILKSLGLVDESGDKPKLRSDIDLLKLAPLVGRYRIEAEKLSINWLQTKVSFP